jgi:hypothetical protein
MDDVIKRAREDLLRYTHQQLSSHIFINRHAEAILSHTEATEAALAVAREALEWAADELEDAGKPVCAATLRKAITEV